MRRAGALLAVALGLFLIGYLIYYKATFKVTGDLDFTPLGMLILLGPLALAWTVGGWFSWRGAKGWNWLAIVASAFTAVVGVLVMARSPERHIFAIWLPLLALNIAIVVLLQGRSRSAA
jgi:hypothetical protein